MGDTGMNMKICICDDETLFCEREQQICEKYMETNEREAEIILCRNGYEVLENIDEIKLLILDIRMPDLDGIELKNLLQERIDAPYIIFVTGFDELMQQAFGKWVLGFVKKEELEKSLPDYLERFFRLIDKDILIDGKYHSERIEWIHAEKEYVRIHEWGGQEHLVRKSLSSMVDELNRAGFVQVHRSWLVNLIYAEKVEKSKITVSGKEIPVSFRKRENLTNALFRYWRELNIPSKY